MTGKNPSVVVPNLVSLEVERADVLVEHIPDWLHQVLSVAQEVFLPRLVTLNP